MSAPAYAMIATAVAGLALTPVILGLYPKAARWTTGLLIAGWIAFGLVVG